MKTEPSKVCPKEFSVEREIEVESVNEHLVQEDAKDQETMEINRDGDSIARCRDSTMSQQTLQVIPSTKEK